MRGGVQEEAPPLVCPRPCQRVCKPPGSGAQLSHCPEHLRVHRVRHHHVQPEALHRLEQDQVQHHLHQAGEQELVLPLQALAEALEDRIVDAERVCAEQKQPRQHLFLVADHSRALEVLAELLSEDLGRGGGAPQEVEHEHVQQLHARVLGGVAGQQLRQPGGLSRCAVLVLPDDLLSLGQQGVRVPFVLVAGDDAPLCVEVPGLLGSVAHQHTLR
mmetsp:Transcript_5900/g.13559  ORF Transcript_5900/g.13559 Transcript_5900/m.13559 type:complete len:216 (-) Transcript_5900:924-1571(-)